MAFQPFSVALTDVRLWGMEVLPSVNHPGCWRQSSVLHYPGWRMLQDWSRLSFKSDFQSNLIFKSSWLQKGENTSCNNTKAPSRKSRLGVFFQPATLGLFHDDFPCSPQVCPDSSCSPKTWFWEATWKITLGASVSVNACLSPTLASNLSGVCRSHP